MKRGGLRPSAWAASSTPRFTAAAPRQPARSGSRLLATKLHLVPTTTLKVTCIVDCHIARRSSLLQLGVLEPLINAMPSLADIVHMACVCKAWRDAARAEKRAWQQKVMRAIAAQEHGFSFRATSVVMQVGSPEFVERCLSIASRIGLDVGFLGVAEMLRRAFQALDLLASLSDSDRLALKRAYHEPEMTLVCQPTDEISSFSFRSSSVLLIARVERIPEVAPVLAEALALGLHLDGACDEVLRCDDQLLRFRI